MFDRPHTASSPRREEKKCQWKWKKIESNNNPKAFSVLTPKNGLLLPRTSPTPGERSEREETIKKAKWSNGKIPQQTIFFPSPVDVRPGSVLYFHSTNFAFTHPTSAFSERARLAAFFLPLPPLPPGALLLCVLALLPTPWHGAEEENYIATYIFRVSHNMKTHFHSG